LEADLDTGWQLKFQVPCPTCIGKKFFDDSDPCINCAGTGKVIKIVKPEEVDDFIDRPEKQNFACIGCRKKEDILRPLPNQLPHGWINWSGDLICFECKSKVLLAAIVAAEQKVRQLKETK
jgi:hypothetical protein